jgi:hypothetical protein
MFVVNIQDVNISNIPDAQNPTGQIAILNYQGRQYKSIQTFTLTQLQAAQGLARYFDEQGTKCAIVKSSQDYSVWIEHKIATSSKELPTDRQLDSELEFVFRAQLYLIDGMWSEIQEILGMGRATSFGNEILASIPSIRSTTYLSATIFVAKQLAQPLEIAIPAPLQLIELYREIQLLSGKYLGKNYAIELLNDLQQGLPSQLKQALQSWARKNLGQPI